MVRYYRYVIDSINTSEFTSIKLSFRVGNGSSSMSRARRSTGTIFPPQEKSFPPLQPLESWSQIPHSISLHSQEPDLLLGPHSDCHRVPPPSKHHRRSRLLYHRRPSLRHLWDLLLQSSSLLLFGYNCSPAGEHGGEHEEPLPLWL